MSKLKRPHVLLWTAGVCVLLDGLVQMLINAEEKRANEPPRYQWTDAARWERR